MAPYRPKSLDELNQAYDKTKAQQESKPAPQPAQPPVEPPAEQQPAAPQPTRSIADTVRARESKQALSGAVDDFIRQFSAKEPTAQSAYAQATQTTQETGAQARDELAQETKQAFDDVLTFPEIKTTPPEPPVYHRYTHEEAPLREGDLAGLMDEYIAVMTDQNGEEEEENRRSFLRRRKEKKKGKQPQYADSEAADDLFDITEAEPDVPQTPAPPAETPFEEPVAPVAVPFEEPAAPVEIPFEEPAAPVEIPFEEPVAPVEIPFEEPVAPVEIPFEEPVAPVEIPFEEPAAPVEIPVEEPVAPPEPVVPKMPEYTPYRSPFETAAADEEKPQPTRTEQKPKHQINMEPEPIFDPHRLFSDLDDEQEMPAAAEPAIEEAPAAEAIEDVFAAPEAAPEGMPAAAEPAMEEAPAAPEEEEPFVLEPVIPVPVPETPGEVPQTFEDIVSYSDETQYDRFVPQAEEEPAAPEEPAGEPEELPEEAEAPQDEDEYDLDAMDLQQEVVIRSSKLKIFFKVLVTLLIVLSLVATAAVGATRLLNINSGKSAVGDYYFFTIKDNDYPAVDIHKGDLVLAKHKRPLDVGDKVVFVQPEMQSFSFGKVDASSDDPDAYNALIYNISGLVVRENDVCGEVQKTIPNGGQIVRKILDNYNKALLICVCVFAGLLLIRVIFLRKKRRYLTVDELVQKEVELEKKKNKKNAKSAKGKKQPQQAVPTPQAAPPAEPSAGEETDLFGDID